LRILAATYRAPAQRNRDGALDVTAEYRAIGAAPYAARLLGFETDDVRVVAVRERGARSVRFATRPGTLGVGFAWGVGMRWQGRPSTVPSLVVVGPDTEFENELDGAATVLRLGLAPAAVDRLRADDAAAATIRRWGEPGVRWAPTSAPAEWRLQRAILEAVRLAECAGGAGWKVQRALGCAADDVVVEAVRTLGGDGASGDGASGDVVRDGPTSRRRLVAAVLDFLDAHPDEPVSVATICRALNVRDRTLQRAFRTTLGVRLQAYERERRLRCAHGAIIARGDRESITAIAMSFGFWHLGRFAGAYRALYGCTPAETRRVLWGGHAAEARRLEDTAA
jgi:AraC family ethanolamine operon transcriptional activator